MDEFFEYAEHQLSQPPAPQDYIAGFTLYAVSRPCDQISIDKFLSTIRIPIDT